MIKIDIKPLSVNECWQGKRFKTPKYKAYETELLYKLPPSIKTDGKLTVDLEFGVSKLTDIDNPVKPFLDILQKKYGFNDRDIYMIRISKKIAKRGEEYVAFKINE